MLATGLSPLSADELSLTGNAKLTGKVRSIDANGIVELLSQLSPEPVLLKPDAVRKVTFESSGVIASPPAGRVELTNGDILPARVVSLDEKALKVSSPDVGELDIPRTSMSSIQFGVPRQSAIYSGPRSLEEWTADVDGAKNWRFVKEGLLSKGPAVAIRKVDVPERFVFKFTLKWKTSPSFTVYFADPLATDSEKVDRYFLQFSPSGFEVKRESGGAPKIQNVIILTRSPDEFPSNEVEVELRVDRKASKIHLYLNGEPEASGVDPVEDPPEGSGFVFVSSSPSGTTQEIRDIEILDFDNTGERHHSEERGDPEFDSLISRDDDRWSGHLAKIQAGEDGMVLSFTSDFQEEVLELLDSDISTVFFASAKSTDAVDDTGDAWVLRLRGGGSLHVGACTISENGVSASHPLLGPLEIRREGVVALERLNHEEETEEEE